MSWSIRTRGSVPRIHTKMNTKVNVLIRNQIKPTTTSNDRNAHAPTTATARTLKSTKATINAFTNDQPLLNIHSGSASNRMSSGTPKTIAHSNQMPMPARSIAGLIVMCRKSRIGRGSMGEFQPPKKSTTVSAERMNTLTYSAKKKKPKRMPLYSVAKPATISLSASVRSNGVRLPSAVAAMKKTMNASGCWNTYQSHSQPDWLATIWLSDRVPASMMMPTGASSSGSSYETIWAAARRPPRSEYLLKLDQPPISRPTTVRPETAKK